MDNGLQNPGKEKINLILAAARERFNMYGYAKVTMDEIAEDIGMAKPSLYYYFPTKEAIFRSVIQAEQDEFAGLADGLLRESVSAAEKLRRYVRLRMEMMGRLTLLNQFDPRARKELAPIFMELFDSFGRCELRAIQAVVEEGVQSGVLRAEHPEKTAVLILYALQGLRLRFVMNKFHPAASRSGTDDVGEQSVLLIETLLHGMETRPKQSAERNLLHETQ